MRSTCVAFQPVRVHGVSVGLCPSSNAVKAARLPGQDHASRGILQNEDRLGSLICYFLRPGSHSCLLVLSISVFCFFFFVALVCLSGCCFARTARVRLACRPRRFVLGIRFVPSLTNTHPPFSQGDLDFGLGPVRGRETCLVNDTDVLPAKASMSFYAIGRSIAWVPNDGAVTALQCSFFVAAGADAL